MREIRTSGSEGGWGGQPPWSTRPQNRNMPPSFHQNLRIKAMVSHVSVILLDLGARHANLRRNNRCILYL